MRRSVILYDIACVFLVFFSAVGAAVLAVTHRADALFFGGLFSALYGYQLILLGIPALITEIEVLRVLRFLLFFLPPGRILFVGADILRPCLPASRLRAGTVENGGFTKRRVCDKIRATKRSFCRKEEIS